MARVTTGARLHVGFQNLSLAHDRLYGGVGVAVSEPRIDLRATTAETVACPDDALRPVVTDVVEALDVPGAEVHVEASFARHVGLGSGTQYALATLLAVATAHDLTVDPRAIAPTLGRGGRSGVGVATFEDGGFVVDGGHPTERFTAAPPATGEWTVPRPIARHDLPGDWRFVVVTPTSDAGLSGGIEDRTMRRVVERADPGIADDVGAILLRTLLPAVAEGDLAAFGDGVASLGRLNGAWYADEQGGVYRPPAGRLVAALDAEPAVAGVGQSSWGPSVFAVTDTDGAPAVTDAARAALDAAGVDGRVHTASPRNSGASVAAEE